MKKHLFSLLALLVLLAAPALAEDLVFSLDSGFYEAPMPLQMSTGIPGATIYYTLDGSTPDERSLRYSGPLTLMWSNECEDTLSHRADICAGEQFVPQQDFPTAHIVRAIAIGPRERSAVVSGTFFIGYDRQKLYGDTPIMLLATDPQGLFDYDRGIYVLGRIFDEWAAQQTEAYESWQVTANFTQHGREWERPVHVTYLAPGGGGFQQEMGMRIKGGASRGNTQKSLRLIAREDYGEKRVAYELYPDNVREADGGVVDRYKSFTLRNGGNDCDFAKIRDPYIANLATGLRFETAQNLPCIAFLNGEYWGLYTLNEEYTDNYIQYHYGLDDQNVVIVKNGTIDEGEDEDIGLFHEMFDQIADLNMADAANYARAGELLDLGSFADYCALQFYILNQDGPFQGNNWQLWRTRQLDAAHPYGDGKWRMMLFDTDFSSGIYDDGGNFREETIAATLSGRYTGRHPARLLTSLIQNEGFEQEFIRACCDVRNLYFAKKRAASLLKDMTADYLPYRADGMHRFGPQWTLWDARNHAQTKLRQLGSFFDGRYDCFLSEVQKAFDLSNACNVIIKVEGSGQVILNGRESLPLTGKTSLKYFRECPLTVTAQPLQGAAFTGWKVSSEYAELSAADALTTQVTFTRTFTLTATFE